jgi:hypothetical protein
LHTFAQDIKFVAFWGINSRLEMYIKQARWLGSPKTGIYSSPGILMKIITDWFLEPWRNDEKVL